MDEEAILSVEERAEKIVSSLDPTTPVLVRIMKPSQVSGGFWMGLLKEFCVKFMSKTGIFMTLVDEQGDEFDKITYLARSNGLSGGWKGFAAAHHLREGDAVVFQLINVAKFRVFIVRKDGGAEIDGARLLQLKGQRKENSRGNAGKNLKRKRKPAAKIAVVEGVGKQSENLAENRRRCVVSSADVQNRNENGSPRLAVGEAQSDNSSDVVDLVVAFELPKHVRDEYYKLCHSRNSFLHTNLFPRLDRKLVTGIISETVKIGEAILSFKPSNTSKDELTKWKTSLEAFEKLGMNVAFMIPRIDEFMKLSFISMRAAESLPKQRKEQKEMHALETKLLESKDACRSDGVEF